jgi:hypothetical protein
MTRADAATHAFFSQAATVLARLALILFALSVASTRSLAAPDPVFHLTGTRVGGAFGERLAAPGDVNGDGYPDLLVGATGFALTSPRAAGRAYLYFGGATFDTIPDVVFDAGELIIGMAARPTDLNGDGRPDIVLCGNSLNHPELRIYFGRPRPSTIPDIVAPGPGFLASTSISIDGSLDVDGDGYNDLVIGWPFYEVIDGESGYFGVVWIYRGGPNFDGVPDWNLKSSYPIHVNEAPRSPFGAFIGPVGDLNGDGHQDLGVFEGRTPPSTPPSFASLLGHVQVYSCGPTFDVTPDLDLRAGLSSGFGSSRRFATVGDIDGDRMDDLSVFGTAFRPDSLGGVGGQNVWLYRGSTSSAGHWPPDWILSGTTDLTGELFGDADFTGDGRRDLIVANPLPHNRILLLETQPLDPDPDIEIVGFPYRERFGSDVTAIDVTGDGVADLVVGASSAATELGLNVGRVAMYDLARPLPARAFLRGDHRVLALTPSESGIRANFRIQLQPTDGAFNLSAIDPSSIRLESASTGDVDAISPVASKTLHVDDADGDGVPDLGVEFRRIDLEHLFALVRGRREITVTLIGRLLNRRRFQVSLGLTVVAAAGSGANAASVEPNPLNPVGNIVFNVPHSGLVTANLYDVRGRRIRTLVDGQVYPEGLIRIPIDGRDERGTSLASGIYFYRIETPDGFRRGRFVVAK